LLYVQDGTHAAEQSRRVFVPATLPKQMESGVPGYELTEAFCCDGTLTGRRGVRNI